MGLTGVTFRDYNIAHVGMIPGTLAYCFIGGTLGAIGESVGFGDDPIVLIVTIVGTVLAIAGMVYISWIAKKEFNKIASRQRMRDEENQENNRRPSRSNKSPKQIKLEPRYEEVNVSENEESLTLGNQ